MPKPRILVLYYSQTGQLREILEQLFRTVSTDADLFLAPVIPEKPFPFPWTQERFYDAMPETVAQVPVPLQPLPKEIWQQDYDLVVLGMTPWFLHPSLPLTSFLKSKEAEFLKDKKVVTVVGSRNMWLNAMELVKGHLNRLGAKHVGNIVFRDKHPNLLSIKTIDRWMFRGIKKASDGLPEAGVAQSDIDAGRRFGPLLLAAATQHHHDSLQQQILAQDGVYLNEGLVLLEHRGVKAFRYWSGFIREKGGPGAAERQGRVKKFAWLLNRGVKILSPISFLSAAIQLRIKKKKLAAEVAYFKSVRFEEGVF